MLSAWLIPKPKQIPKPKAKTLELGHSLVWFRILQRPRVSVVWIACVWYPELKQLPGQAGSSALLVCQYWARKQASSSQEGDTGMSTQIKFLLSVQKDAEVSEGWLCWFLFCF